MKFPVFHWQEPQPHNGEVPTSAKHPPMGTPPLVRKWTPEEESSWPLGPLPPCHVSTAMALRTSAIFSFLGGHLSDVRVGQTPLPFHRLERVRKGEINLLLPLGFFFESLIKDTWLEKRFGLLVNTQLTVISETICCYLEQHCSIELSALMEMFYIYAFQYSNY